MLRTRPRRSSPVSAASFGYFIFHPIRPTEIPTNWYGNISKPIRWAAPPSPASTTSERRSNHQCFPCNAIPTKSDRSSTNPPSNMPPECLHNYVLINNVSVGVGSAGYRVLTALFQKETGAQFTVVPYRGLAPAMQDVIA